MKKYFFVLLLVYFSLLLHAQEKGFGIGVMMGEPSGLSLKLWVSEKTALDAGVAWSFWNSQDPDAQEIDFENSKFQFHIDYLYHIVPEKKPLSTHAIIYVGAGCRFRMRENFTGIGGRIPVGFVYIIPRLPVDFFLEVVPVLGIYPASVFTGNVSMGIRWFF